MLKISNIKIQLEDKKEILHNISLEINPGEIHLLNGKNGSGKSTLVNALMGNPSLVVSGGKFTLKNHKLSNFIASKIDTDHLTKNKDGSFDVDFTEMEVTERSLLGLFLANQYPLEIPGVPLTSFLRLIYNSRRPREDQLPVFKFRKLLEEKADLINYPKELLKRNLNEGFSGGEKKKSEILQMLVLEPQYIFLDEIDSGLDRNSVKEVFTGIAKYKKLFPSSSFIIITHYDKVREYLHIDFEHEISAGNLVGISS